MNKRDLEKEKLDKIGRRLFEATRIESGEIERIIAAPELFANIKTRIKIQESERRAESVFGIQALFSRWNWQIAGAAFAVFAILIMSFASVIVFKKQESAKLIEQTVTPEIQIKADSLVSTIEPTPENQINNQEKAYSSRNYQKLVQPKAVKSVEKDLQRQAQKPKFVKQLPKADGEAAESFYPLTYAGNLKESEDDLQVLRVDLPRSSVVALGLNVPIENESSKIKTDLLVGSDGIARAIRLVK